MNELPSSNHLRNAVSVDPFEIGNRSEVTSQPKAQPFLNKIRGSLPFLKKRKQNLTAVELKDLLTIDPGKVSLDDIKEWATSHVIYYESWGEVRFPPVMKKDFKEARKVLTMLDEERYCQLASFFLNKARDGWRGLENSEDCEESIFRIFDTEDVKTIPWSIQMQGDTAIKNFLNEQKLGLTLRMASTTSATYLRQASVLARIIA